MSSFRQSAVLLIAMIAASSYAEGKTVEELKKAGDLRGLVAKLGDHRATVRRDAAVALPGIVGKIKDPAKLNPIIGRLIDVRFRDPWKSTREYSGRALMNALNKTKDQGVLSNALQPLLDALDQGQVDLERRRYAAVALSAVVMRLQRVDLLRPRMNDLLSATFKDPDEGVRKYAERALQHTLMKLDHEPTLTIAAHPLAAHLNSKDPHFRSYSAVMLSMVVGKIKDRDTLKSLLGRITTAATKDRDKGVREYAGRAMRHIQNALKEEKKPAAPAKGKVSTKVGNQRVLVAKLNDKDPEVRQQAVRALQEVLRTVKNEAELKQTIPALVEATLNDSSAEVRQTARFTLREVLRKVDDQAALIPVMQAFLVNLNHKDATIRSHCAHDLPGVTGKINDQAALARILIPLTSATLRTQSMDANDFPGFALRNALREVEDSAALIPIVKPLLAGLNHKDITMRGFCVHELSGSIGKIDDKKVLTGMLQPLTAATLKSQSTNDRDFPGFALRSVLRKTDDSSAIIPVMQTSIAGLTHKDSTMRAYYAHALHENVGKIKDKTVLVRMVSPLTATTLQVKDSKAPGMSAEDLAYSALKQVLDQVDDQTALKSIVLPMAGALQDKDAKRRRYAAHALTLFAHKINDKKILAPLKQPLQRAHSHDSDQSVRDSAGRVLKQVFGKQTEEKPKRS